MTGTDSKCLGDLKGAKLAWVETVQQLPGMGWGEHENGA